MFEPASARRTGLSFFVLLVVEHTDRVLEQVLGYDAERIASLRRAGALG